ncbi:MAG: hypothetical protein AAGI44_13525 [Pseudomonadota bacterium]
MDEERYLVLVDYQSGGYAFIAYAGSKGELEYALGVDMPGSGITLVDKDIDQHPLIATLDYRMLTYRLSSPTGALLDLISRARQRRLSNQ